MNIKMPFVPFFLKFIFTGCRILAWQFFLSLRILKMPFHCHHFHCFLKSWPSFLLSFLSSVFFPLAAFKIFISYLVTICHTRVLFDYILGFCWVDWISELMFLWNWRNSWHSLLHFLCPTFSSSCGIPLTCRCNYWYFPKAY